MKFQIAKQSVPAAIVIAKSALKRNPNLAYAYYAKASNSARTIASICPDCYSHSSDLHQKG